MPFSARVNITMNIQNHGSIMRTRPTCKKIPLQSFIEFGRALE